MKKGINIQVKVKCIFEPLRVLEASVGRKSRLKYVFMYRDFQNILKFNHIIGARDVFKCLRVVLLY